MTPVAPPSPPVPGGMANTTTDAEMTDMLKCFLEGGADENGEPLLDGVARISSFRDAGLMTSSEGLVISLPGGAEFQVTVVRSR